MSRLPHFIRRGAYDYVDTQIYLNPYALCFDNHESVNMTKISLPPYKEDEKFSIVAFREDDEFRTLLLKEQPKDVRIECCDREGTIIRVVYMRECKCIEKPDYEIEIQYESWEDIYY